MVVKEKCWVKGLGSVVSAVFQIEHKTAGKKASLLGLAPLFFQVIIPQGNSSVH